MAEIGRLPNGRFPPGVSGGRHGGRRRKAQTVEDALNEAFAEKVTVVEGNKRRRVPKLQAAATHVANEGATGKNARLALAALQKASERKQQVTEDPAPRLTESDEAIVARFLARVRLTDQANGEAGNADAQL